MKTLIMFVILSFMTNSITLAQDDLKEVTLYTTTGDSIQGFISYKNKFKTFKRIAIKNKTSGLTKVYTPVSIGSFTIQLDDRKIFFKSLITQADYSSDILEKLSKSPKLKLTTDTIFAQVLLLGARNLYHYIDDKAFKSHYLIETESGYAVDLINKSYYADASQMIIAYNKEYLNQLRSLLSGSPAISQQRITKTSFNKNAIMKIVNDYNIAISTSTTPLYEFQEEKFVYKFGVTGGVNITSIVFKSGSTRSDRLKFSSSVSGNLGITFNVTFPNTRKQLSLYNELLYTSYKCNFSGSFYEYYTNPLCYGILNSASIEASYIKLVTALRYQWTKRSLPYVQFGIVNGYAIQHTSTAMHEMRFYSIMSTEETPLIDFRTYEQSLFAGIGTHYKKIGLEVRCERGNGMSKSAGINSSMTYTYCLLNYTF
jgi:hypothetical protein